jgi:hypothetical protein
MVQRCPPSPSGFEKLLLLSTLSREFTEWQAACNIDTSTAKQTFEALDLDGDGIMSKEEFQARIQNELAYYSLVGQLLQFQSFHCLFHADFFSTRNLQEAARNYLTPCRVPAAAS